MIRLVRDLARVILRQPALQVIQLEDGTKVYRCRPTLLGRWVDTTSRVHALVILARGRR